MAAGCYETSVAASESQGHVSFWVLFWNAKPVTFFLKITRYSLFKMFLILLSSLALSTLLKESLALSLPSPCDHSRRSYVGYTAASITASLGHVSSCNAAETPLGEIEQALKQLQAVPTYIQKEEWDKVRATLITPPLSDLWTRSKRTNALWDEYANFVASQDGDELEVLELKDELQTHLRFLDLAVYNNVFNPIKTFGETGSTKELIRSYYDDPTREYEASSSALKSLLKLSIP